MKNESECCKGRREFLGQSASLICLSFISGASGMAFLQSCEKDWDKSTNQGVSKTFNITPYLKIDPKSKYPFINLKSIGCGIIKRFNDVNYGIPVLIIKTGEHEEMINDVKVKVPDIVCFSSMCTHNNCLGNEDISISKIMPSRGQVGQNRRIICSCHGSEYNAFDNARVVKGPAEKPLRRFPCRYNPETNELTIDF